MRRGCRLSLRFDFAAIAGAIAIAIGHHGRLTGEAEERFPRAVDSAGRSGAR